MSWIKKLANHTSQYFVGEILIIAASMISFPIFARILTIREYGVMNIVSMTVDLFVLFGNAGLRPALFRFFGFFQQQSAEMATRLFATLFWVTVFLSLLAVVLLNIPGLTPYENYVARDVTRLLGFAAILVLFRTCSELILALFRLYEKATLFLIAHVSRKYAGMVLAIYFILYSKLRLMGLFQGLVIGEGAVFLLLLFYIIFRYKRALFQFSKTMFFDCARYGIPLAGQNFSNFLNSVGDRYIIQFYKGVNAVGIYSIGYNLARYVQALFVDTLEAAMVPMVMNLHAQQGEEETKKFVSHYFTIYALIFFPVIFGITAIARDAIFVIASAKFEASVGVVGYVILGVMISGMFFPATIGLHLHKKTISIANIMILTAAINIVLNIILIPFWGIIGAAVATVISCVFQIIYSFMKSHRYLKIKHDFQFYLVCALSGFGMFTFLKLFPFGDAVNLATLIIKIISGIIVYLICMLVFYPDGRNYVVILFKKLTGK